MFHFVEKIIIEQVRQGNQHVFTKIYKAYEEPIYRFIYFRVGGKEIAQDLTSEVFLKILDFLKNKETKIDNFRAFIYKTANNLITDFYRSKKITVSLDETIFSIGDYSGETRLNSLPDSRETINPEKRADQSLQIEQIKKYFKRLKPEYREPVLLHYFEGLPYKDIAEILGESEANVKMRSHRGIKLLKSLLGSGEN